MWQTYLGRCIYESPTGLQVYQNVGYRWLSFGGDIIQTLLNRSHPERPALPYIIALTRMVLASPGDCCLLGLGGAGVAHSLFAACAHFHLTALEASQEVIDIATEYFYLDRIQNLTYTCQLAEEFVQSTTATYANILVDLHNGDDYPAACQHETFWQRCHKLLHAGGMLIVNVLGIKNKYTLFQSLRDTFQGSVLTIPVQKSDNTLMVAYRTAPHQQFLSSFPQRHLFTRIVWDECWGWVGQMTPCVSRVIV